ncbi:extracellular solute-binding protein [Laceyella putida]|uniref:Extracellular solute-binding protein n=1 Tax=Laceyella putida TaxID=110101 RepID=A0ABW2RL41_9BACL
MGRLYGSGEVLKKKTGKYLLFSPKNLFEAVRDQGATPYFNRNNQLVMDRNPQTLKAWNYMVKAKQLGIAGRFTWLNAEMTAGMNKGDFAVVLSAAWARGVIETNSPDTKGLWQAAPMPEGSANMGRSFLTLPKQGKHPQEAYEAIRWLLSPEQHLKVFKNEGNFPSTPSVYQDPTIYDASYPFWQGQKLGRLYGEAAKQVKSSYKGARYRVVDVVVGKEIDLVINTNKVPDKAWKDILRQVQMVLERG